MVDTCAVFVFRLAMKKRKETFRLSLGLEGCTRVCAKDRKEPKGIGQVRRALARFVDQKSAWMPDARTW